MIHVIVEFKDPYSKPIVLLVVKVVSVVNEDKVVVVEVTVGEEDTPDGEVVV